MAEVLLVARDWKMRALLRAQLLEDGVEVEAYETAADAVATLAARGPRPKLLLADLSSSDNPAAEIGQFAAWAKHVPVWIIASRSVADPAGLSERGLEKILYLPVGVSELVRLIKMRLES